MSEEKKGRYTEAQAKAAKKYLKESVEDIRIRVPKGQKDIIKAAAEQAGESLNTYVRKSIDQRMEREAADNDPVF
ncbi:arc-like DNA-binding protein [Blautia obeum CAG:39]|nr:arc-like DNA-binding protein [Blautia obeum CAG:39]